MSKSEKDPAFLFYSRDFYEGTRMMFPEERACYIDLMIYQHQHEYLDLDIKKLLLYCNGIKKNTLLKVLDAKFTKTEKGYYNKKLENIICKREYFVDRQKINGYVGNFWKKCKNVVENDYYENIRQLLSDIPIEKIYNEVKDKKIDENTVIETLEGMLAVFKRLPS